MATLGSCALYRRRRRSSFNRGRFVEQLPNTPRNIVADSDDNGPSNLQSSATLLVDKRGL
jgi:hypothetical protein